MEGEGDVVLQTHQEKMHRINISKKEKKLFESMKKIR